MCFFCGETQYYQAKNTVRINPMCNYMTWIGGLDWCANHHVVLMPSKGKTILRWWMGGLGSYTNGSLLRVNAKQPVKGNLSGRAHCLVPEVLPLGRRATMCYNSGKGGCIPYSDCTNKLQETVRIT